jgi:hypothetical protein
MYHRHRSAMPPSEGFFAFLVSQKPENFKISNGNMPFDDVHGSKGGASPIFRHLEGRETGPSETLSELSLRNKNDPTTLGHSCQICFSFVYCSSQRWFIPPSLMIHCGIFSLQRLGERGGCARTACDRLIIPYCVPFQRYGRMGILQARLQSRERRWC